MPASNTFQFVKGEDIEIDWTIRATSSPTSAVVDITGWTFEYVLKRRASDTGASLVTVATTILVAASGTAKSVIASAASLVLSGGYHGSLWRSNVGARACLSIDVWAFLDSTNDT